jgi:hypothetical protein
MDPSGQQNTSINASSSGNRVKKKPHPMIRHSSTGILLQSNSAHLEEVLAAVHNRNNSIIYDGQSATADESSEFHIRPSRKNPKHSKLINTIVLWVKNVNKMRAMQICKAFYTWKYYNYQHGPQVVTDSPSDASKTASFSEQKTSYLQLFSENEKLREQLFDIKKTIKHNEKTTRYNAMKILIITIIKKKIANKQRYYYDIWFHNTRMMKLTSDIHTRDLELRIGLQHVASEQDSMARFKRQNHTLSMSLATVIFFYKWKNKTILSLLAAERKKYAKQQTLLYEELKRLKSKVEHSNTQEREYLHKSLEIGGEVQSDLTKLHSEIQQLLHQSRSVAPPTISSTHSTPTVTSTGTGTGAGTGRKTIGVGNAGAGSGSKKGSSSSVASNDTGSTAGMSSSVKKLWSSIGNTSTGSPVPPSHPTNSPAPNNNSTSNPPSIQHPITSTSNTSNTNTHTNNNTAKMLPTELF